MLTLRVVFFTCSISDQVKPKTKFVVSCFSVKYAALRTKSKKWLCQSGLTNLPVDCYVVSVSASSIKLQLCVLV